MRVPGEGPTEHTRTAVKVTARRPRPGTGSGHRQARQELYRTFQGEAQDAQAHMELLTGELSAEEECSLWYWRGVRDAYETCAYELQFVLGDTRLPPTGQ